MNTIMKIDLNQITNFRQRLAVDGAKIGVEIENALNDEAHMIATVAKELVPVDLGNLRASITVNPPVMALHENGEIFVEVVAGDVAIQYAQIQEENEDFNHNVGQAHYMRDATVMVLAGVEDRMIRRIEQI